jgi:ABC-2 type transport system ATP-binding protein
MSSVISLKNVTKIYDQTRALDCLTLEIPDQGGVVGLLGPNGSGKTTLIKLLVGLLTPTEGEVEILGERIGVKTKSMISYLSDFHALNDKYTVLQEIEYFSDFFSDFDREKALSTLKELGVDENKKIKTLSKGTKEKISLILALSRNARLFVLDEPIAGVDPAAREYVLQTILSHKDKNATMLISTHLISEIEKYFNYVVFLKDGKLVMQGDTQEMIAREGKSIDELFREVFRWI